jgi:peptide/nickel transport system permease protein
MTIAVDDVVETEPRPSFMRSAWSWVRQHSGVAIGLFVLASILFASLLAPLPYDPFEPDAQAILLPPSSEHWFGTDRSGFDVFSRVIAAGRLDLPLALTATFISLVIGVTIGLLASSKGRGSESMMRVLDVFQAFPLLVLAIVIVTLTGNNLRTVVLAIVLIETPRFVRLTRSQALSVRESRFIEAAYAMGATNTRVLWRHLLPNVSGAILAQASLAAANAIVVIAALSFLGIGTSPTDASWGSMIRSGSQVIATGEWWVALAPGIAVFITVLAFNAIADGIEKTMEEK